MITAEYKGQTIDFNEISETWQWQGYSDKSLAKVREYMDRNLAKHWVPTDAYMLGYKDEIETVTVKSAGANGSLWIQGKHRSEKVHRPLYLISDHNNACLERLRVLRAEREKLDDQIDAVAREMRPFTASDLKVKG